MVKKGLAMSGKLGSEPLGKFYTGKKPKKRREWRGFKDTWYDYVRWLGYWKTLITFIIKPNNIKGFFRYRWMLNYLALPDFMDRHTEGMRGPDYQIYYSGHIKHFNIIPLIIKVPQKLLRHIRLT